MARLLILGGGCRGVRLAWDAVERGHAVRIVTRAEAGRERIEAAGAECWIGDPLRLGTLRGAFEGVAVACWLLGCATGPVQELRALHGDRLRAFARHTIDTTVRGLLYEAAGPSGPPGALAAGELIVGEEARGSAIPLAVLRTDPADEERWLQEARGAVEALLGVREKPRERDPEGARPRGDGGGSVPPPQGAAAGAVPPPQGVGGRSASSRS